MSQMPPPSQQIPQYSPPPSQGAGMAVASMVLGIISVALFCIWYLAFPCAILAIIFGVVATNKAKRGEGGGRGMAKSGLILGIISIALAILIIILAAIGFTVFGSQFNKTLQQMQQQQQQQMTHPTPTNPTGPEAPTPAPGGGAGNPLGR